MWLLALLIIRCQVGTLASNELSFLVEDKLMKVSTVLENHRISVVVPANFSMAQIKIQIKTAAKHLKMVQTLVGDDTTLQKEYLNAMVTATELFVLAESCMYHAQSKVLPDVKRQPGSSCIYVIQAIGDSEFADGIREISELAKDIGSDWTIEQIKGSEEKRDALAALRSKYQYVGGYLENEACSLLNAINSLSIGELPENVIGGISTTICVAKFSIDSYLIRECTNGEGNLICELEIGSPAAVMTYQTLIPLNYKGVQLYTSPNTQFAREAASRRLKIIDCRHQLEWASSNAPTCLVNDVPAECENALDSDAVEEIIAQCRFTQTAPPPIMRLADDGLLILSDKARIREDTRLVQKKPPVVVYSNHPVDVDLGGESYKFGNSVKVRFPNILFSKLSEDQISAVISKGKSDDFWALFSFANYLGHLSLSVQGLFSMIGLIMSIVYCYKNRTCCKEVIGEPPSPQHGR